MAAGATRQSKPSPSFFQSTMRSPLLTARLGIYVAVLASTVVVLGIAAHFDRLLVPGELTRYVPLSIFIATVTLLTIIALLLAPVALKHNPVSTRVELASLALLGVFWLSLGTYTATADMGDLECYADDDADEVIDVPGFSNDAYHAQYRTLESFALINVSALLGFLIVMVFLALQHHWRGYRSVWVTPLSVYPWLSKHKKQRPKLPPPATSKRDIREKSVPRPDGYTPAPARPGPNIVQPTPVAAGGPRPKVHRSTTTPARPAAPERSRTFQAAVAAAAAARPSGRTERARDKNTYQRDPGEIARLAGRTERARDDTKIQAPKPVYTRPTTTRTQTAPAGGQPRRT